MQDLYEVRPLPSYATSLPHWRTFSVGVGEIVPKGRRKPAAIYRVRGFGDQIDEVMALAGRLVHWLNHETRADVERCPSQVRRSSDGDARIILTAAGRKQGWLPAGGAR